jgi:hypothetical protein
MTFETKGTASINGKTHAVPSALTFLDSAYVPSGLLRK